ncbi:MAG: hypothetical protein IKA84_05110 [Clostridia bacterium]|nr:hypothetical protein [Clostridia bacterium]
MKIKILVALLMALVMLLCSCDVSSIMDMFKQTTPEPEHTHSFDDTYSNDATHHWYACECGEKDGLAEHAWNNGVITIIPTVDSDGIKTFTCMECGKKSAQKITYDEYNSGNQGGNQGGNPDVELNGLSFLASTFYKMDEKLPKTPLTLEAVIYVDPNFTGRVGAIFGNYMGIRQDWLFEIHENGIPRFYYTDAGANIKDIRFNEVDVRTGDWVHIAFTFDIDNAKMSVYLDGELAQSVAITADLAADITTYRFIVGGDGRSNNGNYFKGQIKSLAAYSDVRTIAEIATSAANGINSKAEDILVHYELNENSGDDDILDLSPNGFNISKEWLDSHEPTLDYAYSFAVVGDTQWLSKYTPEKMEGIYDWILANQESKKIAHVFGLGDITEDWNTANKEQEWIRAQQYISKLDGKISYSLIRGNHDETKYFNKYFANETYMSQFDGFMTEGDIRNSYKLFTIGKTDYLFLTLDFGASDEMLEWANEVVLAHPNHKVIVTTHAYHGYDGERLTYKNVPSSGNIHSGSDVDTSVGGNNRGYNNGQQIWEKFVSRHPNIFLVMSGHTPVEDVLVLKSEGLHGNVVNQMLIDSQWMDPQKGGVGMVCMLYFSEDGSQMEVEWICTDTGKYYQEHNQFTLDLTDSLNADPHDFKDSYNEKSHHKACECGYIYNEEPHTFDGGILNAEGFMVYSCECGYKRTVSATDDPVALELQALLEKYYNNGVYYREVKIGETVVDTFFNGDKFYGADATELGATADVISLNDFILGKYGETKLDLGWNYYEGVYSSANESTVSGAKLFAGVTNTVDKVTAEELNHHVIIKLWAGDSVVATVTIGLYAETTYIVNHAEAPIVTFTKSNDEGMCVVTAPAVDGYVAEYDYFILSTIHDELTRTVYYSTVAVWDGTTVSESLKGSGTQEDPYLVTSGADLAYIAGVVNAAGEQVPNFSGKYFKLTQSIDLNGHDLYVGKYTGWSTRKGFYGFFDGNHCTVRGLDQNASLFGTIEGGYLKNLSVYGKISNSTTEATGGIVGYCASGGMLENLTNYVTVNGKSTLGGVVGNAENQASTVTNCVNYGDVTGSSYIIGGIAGSGGHDVKNCVNFGNVTSTTSVCVGGIAGTTKTTGKIENCYNYGDIKGSGQLGGIVGLAKKPVYNCVNYGDVSGTWALAGIVGYAERGSDASITVTISECVNHGNIIGTSTAVGGVFGLSQKDNNVAILITNCVNNGDVSTPSWGCGGIAADTHGEVSNCVNNGNLTAQGEVGGIVGKCMGNVTECTNNGSVTGAQAIIGGIVGHLEVSTYLDTIQTTNHNNGTVTGPDANEIIGVIK